MCHTTRRLIAKTRLIFLAMIIASLTFGIAAVTTNTLMTQPASAQSSGDGTPIYTPPPGGGAGSGSQGNSTSGNATK
jgi:hypothetical protein